jgi:hypothetical protein
VPNIATDESVDARRFDRKSIEQQVRRCCDEWQALLTGDGRKRRQVLPDVLAGPLLMTPPNGTYRFEGELPIGRLLAGAADLTHPLWYRYCGVKEVGSCISQEPPRSGALAGLDRLGSDGLDWRRTRSLVCAQPRGVSTAVRTGGNHRAGRLMQTRDGELAMPGQ